jgi:hypothetical protein
MQWWDPGKVEQRKVPLKLNEGKDNLVRKFEEFVKQ